MNTRRKSTHLLWLASGLALGLSACQANTEDAKVTKPNTATGTKTKTDTATSTKETATKEADSKTTDVETEHCFSEDAPEGKTTGVRFDQATLIWPPDRYVAQRNDDNQGAIKVKGRVHASSTTGLCIEAQTTKLNDQATGTALGWQKLQDLTFKTIEGDTIEFEGWLVHGSGGWFQLQTRAFIGNKWNGESLAQTKHVGIGEVFVTAGQSNSTNCGNIGVSASETSDRISMSAYGSLWALARSPLIGPADTSVGGGPWVIFGQELEKQLNVPVAILATGWGGTSVVTQWQVSSTTPAMPQPALGKNLQERYQQTVATLKAFTKDGFVPYRATLWHQGESDALATTSTYQNALAALINTTRASTKVKRPWFVALASWDTKMAYDSVRNAQKQIVNKDALVYQGPDTDQLISCQYRDCPLNSIHLSAVGLVTHGQQWAKIVRESLNLSAP